ncbi:hypothetical protein [Rhodococcus opacus]|uniref:hypothetical protein n=1 Tax=Rhodococcus opacus TaxID=37919 RepID=UPI0010634910|nr:hypothetical protein [Rhodococcus opacus]MDV6241305.1 hypothetical protein [Rhodococcus opacus]
MNQIRPGRPAAPTVDAKRLWAGGAATALLHVLMVSTPRAATFFGWICILATLVSLLSGVAGSAQTSRPEQW